MKIYESIIETTGNTPLVRLKKTAENHEAKAEVLLKLEFMNPLSSSKDRVARELIEDGIKRGLVREGTVIIEPTSGNTGIGLAFVCARYGFQMILVMPSSMSNERKKLLKVLGAKLVLTDPILGMKGAIDKAEELHKAITNSYVPMQFSNPANPAAHRKTTAEEIWWDTEGKVDIFVAAVGTGGTITGVGQVLKERNPEVKVVAVEPAGSPVLSGGMPGTHRIQGIGAGFIPSILDRSILDEVITVTDEAAAMMCQEINKQDGIPVGYSSGAAAWAALKLAARPENEGKRIVVIAPSCSERYLSSRLFENINIDSDELCIENGLLKLTPEPKPKKA